MAPLDVELASNVVFQPDVVVLLKASRGKLKERYIVSAPDLVIEVVSPSSETHDRYRKLVAYARAGVLEYWIVDLDAKTVEVLTLENSEYYSQGVYRGKTSLPSQKDSLQEHYPKCGQYSWKSGRERESHRPN